MRIITPRPTACASFSVWAEPERVRVTAPVWKEHPEYFFAPVNETDADRLLDLGNEGGDAAGGFFGLGCQFPDFLGHYGKAPSCLSLRHQMIMS